MVQVMFSESLKSPLGGGFSNAPAFIIIRCPERILQLQTCKRVEIFLKVEIKFFVYAIFYFLIQQIDNKFLQNNDYLKIRKNLTMLVMIAHIIMLIGIYSDSL